MYEQRITKLQKALCKLGVDALFVSNPSNIYYLTGYGPLHGGVVQQLDDPEAFVVITQTACVLLTDARYAGAAKKVAGQGIDFKVLPDSPRSQGVAQLLRSCKLQTLGFETSNLTAHDYGLIVSQLQGIKLVDCSKTVASLRVIKDKTELDLLREAQRITGAGYLYAMQKLTPGMSEKALSILLTQYYQREADGVSFEPIVAFGPGSAVPHYVSSANVSIGSKGILLVDCGCLYKGYCGDLTRTIYLGTPTVKYTRVYNAVLAAQQTCLTKVRAGMTGSQADALARDTLRSVGYAEYFLHSTGHGVGLDIHEDPRLSKTAETRLCDGMVFSVEPGIYINGWGGVRIEDVVTLEDGKAVKLSLIST